MFVLQFISNGYISGTMIGVIVYIVNDCGSCSVQGYMHVGEIVFCLSKKNKSCIAEAC